MNPLPQTSTKTLSFPVATGLDGVVGNTPLIPLTNLTRNLSPFVQVFVKAEWFNPAGSIKARPALNIMRNALDDGQLNGGRRLLDSTSGNMGIAYATLGVQMGIPVTLVMPASASQERKDILRALGAELILTDPEKGGDHALAVTRQLAQEHPEKYYYANQYDNENNWKAHYYSTGPEIWEQTSGCITHFVAGMGTSGTFRGTTTYLKEQKTELTAVGIQPEGPKHGLEGLKHMDSSVVPGIYRADLADQIEVVSKPDSIEMVRRLAKQEGLFTGLSAGTAVAAALRIASSLEEGVVVTVLPDAGYKYLSDHLWSENE